MNYMDRKLSPSERAEHLLKKMTVKEKICQLQSLYVTDYIASKDVLDTDGVGGISFERYEMSYSVLEEVRFLNSIQKHCVEKTRLGIPAIIHAEALHGLCLKQGVCFPQAIGIAASWDEALMKSISSGIAEECKKRGIRQVLSPTVDVARDSRWGRVEETYGEDPYLVSRMAVNYCKGIEENNVISTPKHFVANFGDGGRDSRSVYHSERMLKNVYFKPYEACIKEAGSRSIMASYNCWNGTPVGLSKHLLTEVLRDEWGFDGCVVTDYGLLDRALEAHKVAPNMHEIAARAVKAGLDREIPTRMQERSGYNHLQTAFDKGLLAEEDIDKLVLRILKLKFELGLFENPYIDEAVAVSSVQAPKMRDLAYRAALESFVLLKNENEVLPITKKYKKIGVIGSVAKKPKLGGYSSWGIEKSSILEEVQKYGEQGYQIYDLVDIAENAEGVFITVSCEHLHTDKNKSGLVGRYYKDRNIEGEPQIEQIDSIIDFYWQCGPFELFEPYAVEWEGYISSDETGLFQLQIDANGSVKLEFEDQTMIERWTDPVSEPEMVCVNMEKGKKYHVKISYGSSGREGRMAFRWLKDRDGDKGNKELLEQVKKLDLAIIVAGINEGEGKDRSNLDLPKGVEKLINDVKGTGVLTAVLVCGSVVTMSNWIDSADSVMMIWYPGQEGGRAVADTLFGIHNPAGRLPVSFTQTVAQEPYYYNQDPSGRVTGYVDMDDVPLFEFGFGKSYTQFEYKNMKLSKSTIHPDEEVNLSVEVTNVGEYDGEEVVQVYINDIYSSIATPMIELKDFKRVFVKKCETETVEFKITSEKLYMLDEKLNKIIEPGDFEIMIGSSCQNICEKQILTVIE